MAHHTHHLIPLTLALLLAGCLEPTIHEPDTAPTAWPSVRLGEETSAPNKLYIYVTNNAPRSYTTGYSDFRVLDANGIIHENDLTLSYWSGDGFPSYLELHPEETAKGYLVFKTNETQPPYRLVYDHPWGRLTTNLE